MIDEIPNVLRRLVSKKVIKAAVVAILGILILFAVYILLLCHPEIGRASCRERVLMPV